MEAYCSPDPRCTPSSGYASSQSTHSNSMSRHQKPRRRHNTEGPPATGPVPHPRAATLLPLASGGGYVILHSLDLADRQRTVSASELQQEILQMGTSSVVQVQPASPRLRVDTDTERVQETSPTRSRNHLQLPLSSGVTPSQHHTAELRTVVPDEVMSPHQRYSDPNPLGGSPNEYYSLRGDQYHRQNTHSSNGTDSDVDTTIL